MTTRPPGYRDRAIPREKLNSWTEAAKLRITRPLMLFGTLVFLCQVLYAVVWK